MSSVRERCSAASARLDEPLAGTASEAMHWLLLEQPGPWGRDALEESDVPGPVAAELAARAAEHGIKVHLVRRSVRREPDGPRTCFLASTERGRSWVEHHRLTRAADVLDLDLAALGEGRPTDPAARHDAPLYLVCTHGRRDACCAELGRPLARAFAAHRPEATWDCAHLGGHRFAPTMLTLPDGLCYGRVPAAAARPLAEAHERGRVVPELLRGRVGDPWAAQVADAEVRLARNLRGRDDVEVRAVVPDGPDGAIVQVAPAGEEALTLLVRREPAGIGRTTSCAGDKVADPLVGRVVAGL
jgi:hypothetical protein